MSNKPEIERNPWGISRNRKQPPPHPDSSSRARRREARTTEKPCARKRNRTPKLPSVMQYQKMNLITSIAVEEKIRKRLDNIIQRAMDLVPIRAEKISFWQTVFYTLIAMVRQTGPSPHSSIDQRYCYLQLHSLNNTNPLTNTLCSKQKSRATYFSLYIDRKKNRYHIPQPLPKG